MNSHSVDALVPTIDELRRRRDEWRREGRVVALVPTMGALHEGHLSLIDLARERSDVVITSVFVNPTQFGPEEDFDRYPRDLKGDLEAAVERGTDVVFAPTSEQLYPVEPTIWVEPGSMADRLCGLSRPGHFRGVLTVVAKLFGCAEPDHAIFGRKDFQQSVLIGRMVKELRMSVEIHTGEIVRERDGVALSSRNAYLTGDSRRSARSLSQGLMGVRAAYAAGERSPAGLVGLARAAMEEAGAEVEYAELVGPEDLEPAAEPADDTVCAVAAAVGASRLVAV